MSVRVETDGPVTTVILHRPEVKNAVDRDTAKKLAHAFRTFDEDPDARIAVLFGDGGTFCAGADLGAIARGTPNHVKPAGDGPMGPTRMRLSKPVIAAIAGYAVAGGLELALWCDLRVAGRDATLGVFCRRFGVPLIDGGTIRLPRLIGHSRAMDLILTGRAVRADEALAMGLVNRLVEPGQSRTEAEKLAHQLARFPQAAMLGDRASAREQWDLPYPEALKNELRHGMASLTGAMAGSPSGDIAGDALAGAKRFTAGVGRHGSFEPDSE